MMSKGALVEGIKEGLLIGSLTNVQMQVPYSPVGQSICLVDRLDRLDWCFDLQALHNLMKLIIPNVSHFLYRFFIYPIIN